jgi:sarcosine oxidase subunit beta
MMKNKASIVIIGGGVIGCSAAYNLSKRGLKDIVLVEKNFLASGATGRCGAGIRQQWGTRQNCFLAKKSMEIFENFRDYVDTEIDIELKQKGYLLLAYSDKEVDQFEKNIFIQHEYGIPSRILEPEESLKIVPFLNIEKLKAAAFCPTDGHANPFHVTAAYAEAAKKNGVTILKDTEVLGIDKSKGRITGVETSKGLIKTEKVLNAAGSWAREIGNMVELDLPVFSERHEILVTEPVNSILDPMVMSFSYNIYCQQSPHGSFIMGYGPENECHNHRINSSCNFLENMSKKATWLLPPLKKLRIVRQWAGSYNISPDKQPIVCESEELAGFYMAIGFSGHGFMLSPAIGIYMTGLILEEEPPFNITVDLGRFERKEIISEPSVV